MFVKRVDAIAPIELQSEDFSEEEKQSFLVSEGWYYPSCAGYERSVCTSSVFKICPFIYPILTRIPAGKNKKTRPF